MIKQHVSRTIIFGIIGLLIGLGFAFFSPKVYEGDTQLVIGVTDSANNVITTLNEDVRAIVLKGLNSNVSTELQILRGKGIFSAALQKVAGGNREITSKLDKYYAMYDVLGDKESNAAVIQARMHDPDMAARLANAIADTYNDTRQATARASVRQAVDYLKSQIGQSTQEVAAAEQAVRDYKEKNAVADFQGKMLQLYSYRTQLKGSLDAATASLGAADAEINAIQIQMAQYKPNKVMASTGQKPQLVQQLETDLEIQRTKRDLLLAEYHKDSLPVRQTTEAIQAINKRLEAARKRGPMENMTVSTGPDPVRQNLEQALSAAKARKDSLTSQVARYGSMLATQEAEIAKMPLIEKDLTELTRTLLIKDQNLKTLSSQLTTLQNRLEVVPIAGTIVQPAIPEKDPVAPDPAKLAFVGLAGGLAFGLLFSLGLESLRARLYSSQQLSELTGLPVVATVPLLPRPAARRMLQGLSRKDGPLIESLRFLAFSSTARPEEHMGKVMFTANSDDSGCSTAAGQYAAAVARTGVRVLLVDCNLRQPTLSRVFSADSKSGVSDILSRSLLASDQNLILETEQPNLRVLPAGSADEGAIKEASTANLSAFLDSLSAYADMIVIDTPPCNIMADASRLAPYVDEVFLVVSAASASARNVPAAHDILSRSGARKVSLVLTHASPTEESFSRQADYMLSRS
jgi:polysaccharide biosynthesis transport protein